MTCLGQPGARSPACGTPPRIKPRNCRLWAAGPRIRLVCMVTPRFPAAFERVGMPPHSSGPPKLLSEGGSVNSSGTLPHPGSRVNLKVHFLSALVLPLATGAFSSWLWSVAVVPLYPGWPVRGWKPLCPLVAIIPFFSVLRVFRGYKSPSAFAFLTISARKKIPAAYRTETILCPATVMPAFRPMRFCPSGDSGVMTMISLPRCRISSPPLFGPMK